jgi:hypothetical protein
LHRTAPSTASWFFAAPRTVCAGTGHRVTALQGANWSIYTIK